MGFVAGDGRRGSADDPAHGRLGSLRMVERYAAVSTEHMAEAMRRLA